MAGALAGGDGVPASGGRDSGRGASAAGPLPLVGAPGGRGRRRPADGSAAGIDRYRHRPTIGTRAALSWGAGGPPNGLGARPAARRGARPDLHRPTRSTRRSRSSACPEVVLHLAVVGAGRDRRRPADRRRPRRHVRPGQRRDPQPDPPSLARGAGAARARPGRGGPGRRCVPPATASWPVTGSASRSRRRHGRSSGRRRTPATFELHRGPATPSRLILPVDPAGRRSGRRAGAGVQDHAARRSASSTAAAAPTGPSGRSTDDVIAGTVTVTIHDGGEDVLEDGRRLYAAETLTLTASDADPARATFDADVVYRWQRTRLRDRDPGALDADQRRRGLRPRGRARGRSRRRAVLPARRGASGSSGGSSEPSTPSRPGRRLDCRP